MPTLPTASELPPSYLYEYTGYKLIAVASAFIALDIVFVGLRYYARSLQKTAIGADDFLIAPALMFCLAVDALAIAMTKHGGVGRHRLALEATDPIKVVNWAKLLLAVEWVYPAAVTLPKLSLLSLYLRIFTTKFYRWSVYILAIVLIGTFLAAGLAGSFECQPLRLFWDPTTPGGHCFDINAYFRWLSLPNIITDVAMLILPQPLIWTLKITRTQKIGLTLTFLTGSVGMIASIFRFTNFFRNDAITDGTFASVELMTWTVVEPGTYLVAACLPSLRPLVRRTFKDFSLKRSITAWTPKYSRGSRERSTANIELKAPRRRNSEVLRSPPRVHRPADGRESSNGNEDEVSLVGNHSSGREKARPFARNNQGAEKGASHIHVEHDYTVSTSEPLAVRVRDLHRSGHLF